MGQIADAALRCFARDGFTGTSMADIIAESGLSAGSIYSHFSGKAELARFAAGTMLEARRSSLAAMTAGGATPGPAEVLTRLYDEMAGAGVIDLLVQIWAACTQDPDLAALSREKIGEVRELLRTALRPWAARFPDEPEQRASDAADTVMLLFQGVAVRGSVQPDADRRMLLRAAAAMLDR